MADEHQFPFGASDGDVNEEVRVRVLEGSAQHGVSWLS
jgi:hypothetical protein